MEGYFNMVVNVNEKTGGIPVTWQQCKDFAICINENELVDVGFKKVSFTW